jgi:twitching motility two-component system response regulator PilG
MLREAMRAARSGDRRSARSLLAEYTQENADDPLGWLWRAAVAHTPELALLWLDQLLERDPNHEAGNRARNQVRLQAGVACARSGDRATARVRFLEATRSDPTDFFAWLELAHHAKSPAEERSALEAALRLRPNCDPARRALAELPESASETNVDPDRLIEIFDDVPESVPLSVVARELPSKESRGESGLHRPTGPASNAALIDSRGSSLADSRGPEARLSESKRRPPRGKSTPVLGQGNPAHYATVLIVDADADHRQAVRAELEKRSVRGLTADGAPQAVVALRDLGVPNLILIDVDLPEVDGFQLCRYLRTSPELANVPIVLTASRVGLILRMRAHVSGTNGVMPKPLSIATIEQLVARHCPPPTNPGGTP